MTDRNRGADHTLLRRLQVQVGDRLEKAVTDRARAGQPAMSGEDEEAFKAELAHQVVAEYARDLAEKGQGSMRWEDTQDLINALKSLLYGAGSLDSLLRDQRIEEIVMNGWNTVFCYYTDGTKAKVAPVYASNEEMIEAIQTLAAHEGLSGRAFDSANTHVNFRVTYAIDTPDGPQPGTARFQAVMSVSTVPTVTIRLHPQQRLFRLKDLVANGTMDQQLADFLAAAVRAKKNLIIGGETAAGKTVLLRACAAEIGPDERLITIERALELGLEDDEDAHPDIVVMEERLPNAEGEGAVPMRDLLMISKRMRPDRVIVGEVLGPEILVMLNAMMQGNDGSLSTIHSNSSEGIVENIVSYAIQAPERLPREGAISMIANGLDFMIFMKRYRGDGEQRRVVHSVREVVGYDDDGLKSNEIFKPGPDGMAMRDVEVGIRCVDDLRAAGYRDVNDPGRWA
ncbi:CpaF family protein [Paenarthrobacter aurescens]|jgi:Flp pilus assembly CpaF family ATPase|uniref:Type II/IV secretion system protein n=1 Tax=Paenarthrobacter aurescens (strain TC1) TaxID=290340 RepID=A1RCC6_PAEAT|nr:ATPase, T2SS/T4P/T4SS family [Paenarthrobacter aurescens]ABM10564.1 putative Type II/IV secretion system protein [Paenarthrobacter aurescens TC1]